MKEKRSTFKMKEGIVVPGYVKIFASKNIASAAAAGDNEMIQEFLDQGISIHWQEADGSTALHAAVLYGHIHTVLFLLDNHANINMVNYFNNTPYDYASKKMNICSAHDCGYTDDDLEELKQILIKNGANPDTKFRTEYFFNHREEFSGLDNF